MERRHRFLLVALGMLILAIVFVGVGWFTDPARQLTEAYEGPASFSLRYPDGWMAVIPEMGMMIVTEPDTLGGEPGPSLTIQRTTALMLKGSLTNTLEYYLTNGPEVYGRQWNRVVDIHPVTLRDGHEAVSIDLRGREFEQNPETYVRLVVTRADNMVVYVLGLSAPSEQWSQTEPLLMAILDSIEFAE